MANAPPLNRAQTFEDYVQLQAAAAEFTRQSWNSLDELQRRIQELEAELQVVSCEISQRIPSLVPNVELHD